MYPRASSSPFCAASCNVCHSATVTILLSLQTPWSSGEVQRAFGAGGGRTMCLTPLRSTTLRSTTLRSTTLRSPDLVVLRAALLATRMRRRSSRCAMMPLLSFLVSSSSSISSYPSAMLHSFFFAEGGSGRAVVDEDGVDGGLISMIIFWPVCLGWTNGRGVGFDRLWPIELTPGGGGRPRL